MRRNQYGPTRRLFDHCVVFALAIQSAAQRGIPRSASRVVEAPCIAINIIVVAVNPRTARSGSRSPRRCALPRAGAGAGPVGRGKSERR